MNHGSQREENRDLLAKEQELLTWFLERTDAGQPYLGQVSKVRVVGSCSCGCPTINFGAPNEFTAAKGATTIVADGEGVVAGGGKVGVIVHVRGGWLSELEVYSMDAKGAFALPPLESCEVY